MRKFLRFLTLPSADRRVLIGALAVAQIVALALKLLPFSTAQRWWHRAARVRGGPSPVPLDRLIWALECASHLVPWTHGCFVRAVTGQILLARHGYQATVRLGVMKPATSRLEAHAWLENAGLPLVSCDDLGFVPLAPATPPSVDDCRV